jgi:hypothetical protein
MTALIESCTPEELAELQAHFDAEGCVWHLERFVGYDYDDCPRYEVQPCGAPVTITDAFGSWACADGHHHFTYGSPAWQGQDLHDWAEAHQGLDD